MFLLCRVSRHFVFDTDETYRVGLMCERSNPRRACAARVLCVCVCVCVCVCECFQGPHLQLTQLSDKVGILAVSVSCSLVFKKGVFRIMAWFRR